MSGPPAYTPVHAPTVLARLEEVRGTRVQIIEPTGDPPPSRTRFGRFAQRSALHVLRFLGDPTASATPPRNEVFVDALVDAGIPRDISCGILRTAVHFCAAQARVPPYALLLPIRDRIAIAMFLEIHATRYCRVTVKIATDASAAAAFVLNYTKNK